MFFTFRILIEVYLWHPSSSIYAAAAMEGKSRRWMKLITEDFYCREFISSVSRNHTHLTSQHPAGVEASEICSWTSSCAGHRVHQLRRGFPGETKSTLSPVYNAGNTRSHWRAKTSYCGTGRCYICWIRRIHNDQWSQNRFVAESLGFWTNRQRKRHLTLWEQNAGKNKDKSQSYECQHCMKDTQVHSSSGARPAGGVTAATKGVLSGVIKQLPPAIGARDRGPTSAQRCTKIQTATVHSSSPAMFLVIITGLLTFIQSLWIPRDQVAVNVHLRSTMTS